MSKSLRVAIILVNWRTPDDTIETINSLIKLKYDNFFVLVVDNGSGDDSVARIRDKHPKVQIIEQSTNLGFAGGNNIGIKAAIEQGADAVWLLNTDTIVAPDSLGFLVNAMGAGVGIVGSRLYFYQDDNGKSGFDSQKLQFDGGKIFWASGSTHSLHLFNDTAENQDVVEVDYTHGASMLVAAEVFEKVGYLPEFYFLNYEETDFCQLVNKAGYKLLIQRRARVWHKVGASMGSLSVTYYYYMHRNVWYFVMRQAPWFWKVVFVPRYLLTMAKGFVIWSILRRSKPRVIFAKAAIDAIFWRSGKAAL